MGSKIIIQSSFGELPFLGSLHMTDSDGIPHAVGMKFDFSNIWSFAKDTKSTAFDFLLLSHIVYCVDRFISRSLFSDDGWHRDITVNDIPILNLSSFAASKAKIESAISFLTGDTWHFNFVQALPIEYKDTHAKKYNVSNFSKVCLFSGGLDSLIGFVDEAATLEEDKKILLVSHKELGKEGGDQKRILDVCRQNDFYQDKYKQVLLSSGLKSNSWVNKLSTENTFRSRSLLFIATGIYCANAIGPDIPLIIPENGTISLNIPLEKGRRGACSTRTTHPTFLKRISEALVLLGIYNSLYNPYQCLSKADMMFNSFKDPEKKRKLEVLSHLSCSCAKRSHNRWWDKRGGKVRHCGYCLPCIYRRVALDVVGMDDFKYIGTDIYRSSQFHIDNYKQARSSDIRSLLYFLKYNCNPSYIRRELLSNGVSDFNELEEYVTLILRSYQQVSDWINSLPR